METIGNEYLKPCVVPKSILCKTDSFVISVCFQPSNTSHKTYHSDGISFIFLEEGYLELLLNSKRYQLREGTLCVFLPGDNVDYVGDESTELFNGLAFSASPKFSLEIEHDALFAKSLFSPRIIELNENEKKELYAFTSLLTIISANNDSMSWIAIRDLVKTMSSEARRIWERLHENNNQIEISPKFNKQEITSRFIYIFSRTGNCESTIVQLQIMYGITRKTVERAIKATSGRSIKELSDNLIVEKVKHLLLYSEQSIKSISHELGFPNQNSFYQFFRRIEGISPTQYRMGAAKNYIVSAATSRNTKGCKPE